MTHHHHLAALCAAYSLWQRAAPGRATASAAAALADALRDILADGWAVRDSGYGGPWLVPLHQAADAPIPEKYLRITGPLAHALAAPAAPAEPAPRPALAREGPLTPDELSALSRAGWVPVMTEPGGRLRMANVHDPEAPEEALTPGGWRALL